MARFPRRRDELERRLERELRDHVALEIEENGGNADAARRALGNRTLISEDTRAEWGGAWMESLLTDMRRAARRLRRAPGFGIVTVVTLALGIGASTAMFSTVGPVLLQALPYPDGDRVVVIADASGGAVAPVDVTFGTFREVVARSRSLQWGAVSRAWQPTLTGFGDAERLDGQSVSAAYFRVLGIRPALGRNFAETDDVPGAAPVAIIADGLWRRRFGADASLIGRTITLDGAPVMVIGIMPRTFENVWSPQARIWRPLRYDPSLPAQGREWGRHLQMVARVAPDTSLDAARQELASIAGASIPQFARPAQALLRDGFIVTLLQDRIAADAKATLRAVVAGTVLLLLITVVNVINLMLARSTERRRELATSAAFGASRAQLLRPLLAEGLLLATIGGALGVAFAYALVGAVVGFDGFALPRVEAIRVDRTALLVAGGLTASIGVVAGCLPGWFLTSRDDVTRSSPRIIAGHHRLRFAFVAAEVALAMVLLVGAGLLVRTIRQLLAVPPGFRPERVLTLQVQATGPRFRNAESVRQFFERVRVGVRSIPGVESVALTSQLPFSGDADVWGVGTKADVPPPPGVTPPEDEERYAHRYAVSASYIETMGIPLQRGRALQDRDRTGGQRVAVISASLARRRFVDGDPIGQQFRFGPTDNWFTIVGIVGDVRQSSLAVVSPAAFYVPEAQWQFADQTMWVVLRTTVEPETVEADVRDAIRSIDAGQPIFRVGTMEQRVSASMGRQRFVRAAFGTFALVALLLATIGIYGVLAGGVAERAREIALRAAVGASRARIIGSFGRQALDVAVAGIVVGGGVAVATSQVLASLLFEVSPLDGVTYGGVAVLLAIATTVGAVVPAWRAARIPPAVALQSQ